MEILRIRNNDFSMENIAPSLILRMRRTSVFLYYKTQAAGEANRRTVCEGELTLLRSRVVGNKNLFKVAQQLELGNFSRFIRSGSFC
jgi:hypothetical protein